MISSAPKAEPENMNDSESPERTFVAACCTVGHLNKFLKETILGVKAAHS